MAAPVQPAPLNGISGFDSVTYVTNQSETFVSMKKMEGGKEYWVTLTFYKPIDEANIRSYLASKETKDKIVQMVKQYEVFEAVYAGKKDFKLEATGKKLYLVYTGKNNSKRLNMSEVDFELSFQGKLEAYQKKIDQARDAKKTDRQRKFTTKKEAFGKLREGFRPISKILEAPAHPDPKPTDPAIHVGAARPQTPAGNPAAPAPAPVAPPAPVPAVQPAPAQQQAPAPIAQPAPAQQPAPTASP
ncbi:MAG: hypothetical protein LLG04_07695 [Parachlamydia sp.]|nr:hypothetical protein [Parachlamydia sp.]